MNGPLSKVVVVGSGAVADSTAVAEATAADTAANTQ